MRLQKTLSWWKVCPPVYAPKYLLQLTGRAQRRPLPTKHPANETPRCRTRRAQAARYYRDLWIASNFGSGSFGTSSPASSAGRATA